MFNMSLRSEKMPADIATAVAIPIAVTINMSGSAGSGISTKSTTVNTIMLSIKSVQMARIGRN
ncbi:hypothetical protein DSOL_2419 [Desulfosporosinus metallidurans]|uniref:Uncharacterized protein n=1 Tax=Desulfosporosinus metallidurans TaxID=1888891 RepID=A0A1Q8QWM9_9FIRM|nr:hypothetical protein DSOL_2419 [Desulfosporosinus metallidurans]